MTAMLNCPMLCATPPPTLIPTDENPLIFFKIPITIRLRIPPARLYAIVIGGNSGFMTGIFMMGGRIVILGDVGEDVAESIIRGVIYVKGEVKSLGYNAKIDELTWEDKLELKELLEEYDFDLKEDEYEEFKKIVPESARPFYGH